MFIALFSNSYFVRLLSMYVLLYILHILLVAKYRLITHDLLPFRSSSVGRSSVIKILGFVVSNHTKIKEIFYAFCGPYYLTRARQIEKLIGPPHHLKLIQLS